MGAIKIDEKLTNGNAQFSITYGGKESPFGGMDSSMPPRYIDPNCFVDMNNFMISAGQLVACGWKSGLITLDNYPVGASSTYLGGGNFFSHGKYYNWALNSSLGAFSPGPPPYQAVVYKLWVWEAGTLGDIPLRATLTVNQFTNNLNSTAATARIFFTGTASGGSGNIVVNINTFTGGARIINQSIGPTDTAEGVASSFASLAGVIPGVFITLDESGTSCTLTTTPDLGNVANLATIAVSNTGNGVVVGTLGKAFGGALPDRVQNVDIALDPISWVVVGESVYIGGSGAVILKFTLDDNLDVVFEVLTLYIGANTLQKFNSQLIAAGIIAGSGLLIDSPEMIIAWSAPEGQYAVWNPIDPQGNVTGAGFNQEADISDYITGMFIIPGAAAILRAQGIDYLTALQNTTIPFDFQHISNSKRGEGCQDSRLVTQYDMVGMYVGNSDIFVYDGKVQPVGDKIKNLIVAATATDNSVNNRAADSGVIFIQNELNVYGLFLIDTTLYVFNLGNKTWTIFDLAVQDDPFDEDANDLKLSWLAMKATSGNFEQFYNEFKPYLVGKLLDPENPGQYLPVFWEFSDKVQTADIFFPGKPSFILFPEEEVDFGKDITIDAMLVSIAGEEGQEIVFTINGFSYNDNPTPVPVSATKTFNLPAGSTADTYRDYKIYFDEEIFTGRNPQLRIDVPLGTRSIYLGLSFQKITMFGSFDPNQRPV